MRIPGMFWSAPLVLGCLVAPQPRVANTESVRYPVKSYDDASGIRVVLEQSPDYGVASVVLSISAGSAQEIPAKAGLAHLAEHLVFQGSHAGTNLWNRIVELGGFGINGATNWDTTRFWATVPTPSASKLVALFAEILREPLQDVDQQAFESELKVVREEFHLRSENGAPGQAVGWLFPALFSPGHPYAHPIAGTSQSLDHLSLADVQSFVAEHYKADLATIALSAPETIERESAWVGGGFGGAPGVPHQQPASGRSSDAAYAHVSGAIQRHEAPIAAPALWIGWPVPREQAPGGEVLPLLPSLLQGAFAAERRAFDARVVRIEPSFFTGRQGAVLYVKLSLRDADSAESLVGTFVNQLRAALTNLIYTPGWFDYARQSSALESTYREENILTRTLSLASSTALTDDPLFARKEDARLRGVTAEAASAYIGEYLREETARAVLVTPTTKARSASFTEAGASAQRPGAVAPVERRLTVNPTEATRWIHESARVARTTLGSGLEVWVVQQRQSPFHAALLDFRGGRELGNNPGVFVAVPWARLPLGEAAFQSGLLSSSIRAEDTRFAYRGVGSDVESTLRHLRRELDASVSWPPRQFTDQVDLYKKEEKQPAVRMRVEHFATLFEGHVYGRSPTIEQIQAVSSNDIHGWFEEVIRPENGVLIVVGDVNPTAVFRLAASAFDDFVDLGAGRRPPVPPPPPPAGPTSGGIRIQAHHQPDLTLSRILFSCLVPLTGSDDFPPARLYQQLLHNRLQYELRDRARASYSISMELSPERARTAVLTMSADVDNAALGSLVEVMKQKFAVGAPSLVNDRALDLAKTALISEQMWQTASTSQLADRLFLAWNLGWPAEAVLDTARRSISAREAQVQVVERACRDTAVLSSLGQ